MNIRIKKMEYETASVLVDVFIERTVNLAIQVEFAIGNINGSISIPVESVSTMDENKVIEYIYNYLNKNLERKFIDEI